MTAPAITPTGAQMEAIVDIATTDRPITRLHGYAGTGKTSGVAMHAVRALERQGVSVQVLAPTGKAAKVLRSKGLHGASTIHSYLYAPSKRERLAWREQWDAFVEKLGDRADAAAVTEIDTAMSETNLDDAWASLIKSLPKARRDRAEALRDDRRFELAFTAAGAIAHYEEYGAPAAQVLFIDEASMVSAAVAADLRRTGSRLVYAGDPAQLPPVKAQRSDDAMGEPHHLLTKVLRQAEGSDVLTLANRVRTAPEPVVPLTKRKHLLSIDEYDQVLCWRNATREHVNAEVRRRLGRKHAARPEPGDRLVCLKNTKPGQGENPPRQWMNGEQATVLAAIIDPAGEAYLTVRDDEGSVHEVVSPMEPFEGYKAEQRYIDRHGWASANPTFTFGYALTVHKSQGSEWPRVLLIDESGAMRSMTSRREGARAANEQARQWLYTGITRAAKLVHIVDDVRSVM